MEQKSEEFVWYSLRIAFWVMIVIWALFVVYPVDDELEMTSAQLLIAFVWVISMGWSFVVAIIHLVSLKTSKSFPITALVISAIALILFTLGLIAGLIEELLI